MWRASRIAFVFILGVLVIGGAPRAEDATDSLFNDTLNDSLSDLPEKVADSALTDWDALGDSTSVEDFVPVDTVLYEPGGILGGYIPVNDTTNRETLLTQNPTVALFKSLVLPGWGQLGNHRRTKAIAFFGLEVVMIGAAIHFDQQASDFRDLFDATTELKLRNEYYSLYEDRRGRRNNYLWFAGLVAFISMFDAYVDAHLSGFPHQLKDDRLELGLGPNESGDMAAVLSFRF